MPAEAGLWVQIMIAQSINVAVASARKAFEAWTETPVMKRAQVLYRFRGLIEQHLDELVRRVATEHGKVWDEALGDVLKAKEVVELARGVPSMMTGDSMMNATAGYDTVLYREPPGAFAGISPFNFPGNDSYGVDDALCIATATRWFSARRRLRR